MSIKLDGKATATAIKAELALRVKALRAQGIDPCLTVILAGEDPASAVYVRNKIRSCEEVGLTSRTVRLPESVQMEELEDLILELNADPAVHGILVQLPLPKGLDEDRILTLVDPAKDVDGFHPLNAGPLLLGLPGFLPCTPSGIIELLKRNHIEMAGKNCVVVGRSNIVGKPMALLMLREDATVTITHSRTVDLPSITSKADIVISAIGRPKFLGPEYFKDGAVVVDCGMNRDENGKLCGDVDYDNVEPKCAAITPVPGGVGPMTVAMLMVNCVLAAEKLA